MRSHGFAFVTYETPFAPCGGIQAVMGYLPHHLREVAKEPVLVISPFHYKMPETNSLATDSLGRCEVVFEGETVALDFRVSEQDGISWIFLRADNNELFAGFPHPYCLAGDTARNARLLLRDSLLFGIGVERLLEIHYRTCDVLLQDWEAATTALAAASRGIGRRLFLTLNNSYDTEADDSTLAAAGLDPATCPGTTVLQRALTVVQPTVLTVSEQFAIDLLEDPFQARVMAPHLGGALQGRLAGVDNGPFVPLAPEEDVLRRARDGDWEPLRSWKRARKRAALSALRGLAASPDPTRPVWGDLGRFSEGEDAVWFLMAGRDDPRQKGYEVAVEAARRLLRGTANARFLFFPIPGDEGLPGLEFLRQLVLEHPDNVLALPFRWDEGFFDALQGATYGLMPSFYEPFGMANELYLSGVVGICRATGGLLQQIVPLRHLDGEPLASFSPAVEAQLAGRRDERAAPTGLLFREPDGIASALDDWNCLNAAEYELGAGANNRLVERWKYALFREMTGALLQALRDGMKICTERPDLYFEMLVAGITYIEASFSWTRAAQQYMKNTRGG